MKRQILFLIFVSIFVLGISGVEKFPTHVPGQYLVKLKQAELEKSLTSLEAELGVKVARKVSKISNLILIESSETLGALKKRLKGKAEYVERNAVFHIESLPNDPRLGDLWGMHNTGQVDPGGRQGVEGIDIDAPEAWEITAGSHDTIVAVIDTGVNHQIADLTNNMWVNQAEKDGKTGVDDDENGFIDDIYGYDFANDDGDPMDDHGHGSHCAGTIGAEGDNEDGVVGVNWQTRIMGVKFLTASGSGTLENAVRAIDYATQMGAQVLSNSWGCSSSACNSQALKESIERSSEAGRLFVAAAGNSSANNDSSPHYPSNFEVANVVSVAAINNSGELASFSSFGKNTVHLGAPGRNILSTTLEGLESWSGTSMATPHVSGVAALVLSNEDLSMEDLKSRLINTARPLSAMRNTTISGGIVNAYHALTNTVPPPDPNDPAEWEQMSVSISTPHPYENSTEEEWEVDVPGAVQIAIHFKMFDTESGYDTLEIFDANGKLVETLSGNREGIYSKLINGSSARLVFKSDASVVKEGIEIDKIAYK